MYIRKVTIENVRSIQKFEMEFPEDNEAGWHVIIGDNGSGKTTALRVVVSTLFGSLVNVDMYNDNSAESNKYVLPVPIFDLFGKLKENDSPRERYTNIAITDKIDIAITGRTHQLLGKEGMYNNASHSNDTTDNEEKRKKIFDQGILLAFGPYRQITPYGSKWEEILAGKPKVKRVINLFYDDATFYETGAWLRDMEFIRKSEEITFLKGGGKSDGDDYYGGTIGKFLQMIYKLLNFTGLLPYNVKVIGFKDGDKLLLKDGNNKEVAIFEMSAGYRSVLALVFEIIRHMIDQFGVDAVFKKDRDFIDCEGVVLIDEIDAHLHPTWQTRIGQWFTTFFPKIQFIVTTHSPLICRACEKGSIWRLAAPGSEIPSGEITGTARDRLIYGNVLDAYGTEVFGESPVMQNGVIRSSESQKMLKELGRLNALNALGKLKDEDKERRLHLQTILSTDAPTGY